jgi:cytochrome P450
MGGNSQQQTRRGLGLLPEPSFLGVIAMQQRIRWAALHGVLRGLASIELRRGDPLGRIVADPAIRADPVPFMEEMRSRGGIVKGRGGSLVVAHRIAEDVLRSDNFRVVAQGSSLPKPLRWVVEKTSTGLWHPLQPPSLLAIEPPEHTRYRLMLRPEFTTSAVDALRHRVEQIAKALLCDLADRRGIVDIVEPYCVSLPIAVIGDVLGVHEEERRHLLEFAKLGAPSLDFGESWQQYLEVQHGIAGFNAWLAGYLRRLRRDPENGLLSELARDGRLDDGELQALAGLVVAAGYETTINLLSNGIRLLLENRHHLKTLAVRPGLWPNAVDEILRFDSPVQLTVRVARRDVDFAGTTVRRGEIVVVYLAGANRDPAVFDDPHHFDIERPNAHKHLSFSSGRHFCLGAALARAEGEVGLRSFFDHYPDARLADGGSRRDTRVLRGWSSLPVTLVGSGWR